VDDFIELVLPHLEPGRPSSSMAANSRTSRNHRRTKSPTLESKGMLYVGTGVSGGEEGRAVRPRQ